MPMHAGVAWMEVLAALAIIAAFVAAHYLEKRHAKSQPLSDEDFLFMLARLTESSEFDHFLQAAEDWNVSRQQAEKDFTSYLLESRIPAYVRDYLRKTRQRMPEAEKYFDRRRDPMSGGSGPKAHSP